MPKVSCFISPKLDLKLKKFVVAKRKSLRGGQGEIIAAAIDEYLQNHSYEIEQEEQHGDGE